MKRAVFNVRTLAEAMAKANRIAPTKGAGFDQAAGIQIVVDPQDPEVHILATDLVTDIRASITPISVGDEAVTWRVPASIATSMITNMPADETITVKEGKGFVYFICGNSKTASRIRPITGDYPEIPPYHLSEVTTVPNLAQRLQQVAWAVDSKRPEIGGVRITGEYLYGTDTSVLAMVPCRVPVGAPVTAHLANVAALLRNTTEVHVGITSSHIRIMPDEHTQTSTLLIEGNYPDIPKMLGVFTPMLNRSVNVDRERLLDAVVRSMILATADRLPRCSITFGKGTMKLEMDSSDVGMTSDEFDVGGGDAIEHKATFTPTALKGALEATSRPIVSIDYGNDKRHPIRVRDDGQYEAVIMPRVTN
jgi:DNA polymerase III sliding clamp (beta) subunit (PCNA family)